MLHQLSQGNAREPEGEIPRPGALPPLSEALAGWRRSIQAGGGAVAPAVLRKQLWDALGPEVSSAKVVLISPDGPLCALPFAALPGKRAGTYLVEDVSLAIAPTPVLLVDRRKSMTEFLAKRDTPLFSVGPRPALMDAPLLVGGVDFTEASGKENFQSLPGSEREVESIQKVFAALHPGERATLLTGNRATAAAVRQDAQRHKWVHLATHGYYEPARTPADRQSPELRSALVLAGGKAGILPALEVAGLDLTRTELVVLSACETGLGKTEQGEGVLGLQRAFQVAGARSVAASLWQVPDEATSALMDRFYRNLWQGKKTRLDCAVRSAALVAAPGMEEPRAGARHGPPRPQGPSGRRGRAAAVLLGRLRPGRRLAVRWVPIQVVGIEFAIMASSANHRRTRNR